MIRKSVKYLRHLSFSLWVHSALFCLLVSLLLAWALPYGLELIAHGAGLFEKAAGICCALVAAALAFILAAAYLRKTFQGAVYGGRTTYGESVQGLPSSEASSQEALAQGILSQDTSTQGLPLQEASSQEILVQGTSPQRKLPAKGFGVACAGILRALFAFSALALLFALAMGLLALPCYALLGGGAIDSQALRQGMLVGIGILALLASPFFIHTIFACAFGGDGWTGSGSGAAGSAHRRQRGGTDPESETGPGHPGRPGALPKAGILPALRRFAALFTGGLLPGMKRYLRLLFLSFAFFFLSLSIIWGIGHLSEGAVSAAARLLLLSALAGIFLPLAVFLCGIRPDVPGAGEEGGAGILRGSGSDSAAARAKALKNGCFGAGIGAGFLKSRAARKAAGRVISIALCFLLIFPLLCEPAKAYADTLEGRPRYVSFPELERNAQAPEAEALQAPAVKPPEDYYPQEEAPEGALVSLEEYARTWKTGEGEYTTEISAVRQAFKDEDGKTQPVDNSLELKDPLFGAAYYENAANAFTARFPAEGSGGASASIKQDGEKIELKPIGADLSRPAVSENMVRYSEAYPGVDLQYTVLGDLVKEDIILSSHQEAPSFEFDLETGGLRAEMTGSAIAVYKEGEASPRFLLAPPMMIDASGAAGMDVQMSLKEAGGKKTVTLTPDAGWLSAPGRAYPVRIDPTIVSVGLMRMSLTGVEQGSPDSRIGDNGYPYAGYDDGIKSGNLANHGAMHMMTRTYVGLDYRFLKVPREARIESAEFRLHHYTRWSGGSTEFGLYRPESPWDPSGITWNSQVGMAHEFIGAAYANAFPGYISWDVRETVNEWVKGIRPNYGFVVKALDELAQCEVFSNMDSAYPPSLTVSWSIPDPVDPAMDIGDMTISLRPVTEKNISGLLAFRGVFADGTAKPGSDVTYRLLPGGEQMQASASYKYEFPDSTPFDSAFAGGTRYKDLLSNWQTSLFSGLDFDKAYHFGASASYYDEDTDLTETSAGETLSEKFLIYKVRQRDTFPYIAKYYGVPLSQLMRDNRVQDSLAIDGNTLFIREPKTEAPYSPPPLSESQMRDIDRALIGRGLHCEYGFEPVNLNTGNFLMEQTDAQIPEIEGSFSIERTYNSMGENHQGAFGRRWDFAFSKSLSKREDGAVLYGAGDGKTLVFTPDGSGGYESPSGYFLTLTEIPYTEEDGKTLILYELKKPSGAYLKFNAWGLLTEEVSETGLCLRTEYDENLALTGIVSPTEKRYAVQTDSFGRIIKITQPDGGILKYAYDSAGNLVSHTDAEGGSVRYEYDAAGRMIAAYDQNGTRTVKNAYDATGRVTEQWDALGGRVFFSYTEGKTRTEDAKGNVTVYHYDMMMRTVKIEYPDGTSAERTYHPEGALASDGEKSYSYDSAGNLILETRSDGKSRLYEYDAAGRLTKTTGYGGSTDLYTYDQDGNLITHTRPGGQSESYAYDSLRRLSCYTDFLGGETLYACDGANLASVTDACGNVTTYGYDAMNRAVSITDAEGNITRVMYDKKGRMIGKQTADGAYTAYTLDAAGNIKETVDPRGYAVKFHYDSAYNIVKAQGPEGSTLSYTYDANGNKISETDGEGNETRFFYDSMDRLAREEDPEGNAASYAYDGKGRLILETAPGGGTKSWTYDDALGLPVSETDEEGGVSRREYSAEGKLLKLINPDGTFYAYEYDDAGRIVKLRDAQGKISEFGYTGNDSVGSVTENGTRTYRFSYDACGRLLFAEDPLGGIIRYEYDRAGRKTKETDANGNETRYTYDGIGRLISSEDPLGNTVLLEYDPCGNLVRQTSAAGRQTAYSYDGLGNLISTVDAEGGITAYVYDSAGRLSKTADACGGVTSYEYSPSGRPLKITDAKGRSSAMAYDADGNLATISLPAGGAVEMNYSPSGRLIREKDAYGTVTEYAYDAMGRILLEKDSSGRRLSYSYDAFGRLSSVKDQAGREEKNIYDSFSQIISKKGMDGAWTHYDYDALGRMVREVLADGGENTAVFDPAGNLVLQRTPLGGQQRYSYDGAGRAVLTEDPYGNKTEYAYDQDGNLLSEKRPDGAVLSCSYDGLSRMVSETDGRGKTSSYAYDALSRPVSVTTPEGGRTELRYDAAGNLTKLKDPLGNISEYVYDAMDNLVKEISPKGAVKSYAYDAHGFLVRQTDPLGNTVRYDLRQDGKPLSAVLPDGSVWRWQYDLAGRTLSETSPLGLERRFSYSAAGDLEKQTDSLGREQRYTYDLMHRLTGETDALGNLSAYAYDLSGNPVSVTAPDGGVLRYTYDLMGRLSSEQDPEGNSTSYSYDAAGNLASVTKPDGGIWRYTYDLSGNLASVTDALGNRTSRETDGDGRVISETDALGSTVRFGYDAAGRMVRKTDALGRSTSFSYDPHGNLLCSKTPAWGGMQYAYDLSDNLVSAGSGQGIPASYAYDPMGRLSEMTSPEGRSTRYTWDAMGNLLSEEGPDGAASLFEYDIAGRLVKETGPGGSAVSYGYGALDLPISKSYEQFPQENVSYAYDVMGRRAQMRDGRGSSSYSYDLLGRPLSVTDAKGRELGYSYGASGQLSELRYPNGSTISYAYDQNGRLSELAGSFGQAAYEYDAAGRLSSVRRPGGLVTSYEYDGAGGLILAKNTGPKGIISSYSYSYDERGFVSEERAALGDETAERSFSYGEAGELLKVSERGKEGAAEYSYGYDQDGNRTLKEKRGAGSSEKLLYTYDEAGRLTGSESSILGKSTYSYDAEGSLISKSGGGEHLRYTYGAENRLTAVYERGSLLMTAAYDGDGNKIMQANRRYFSREEKGLSQEEAEDEAGLFGRKDVSGTDAGAGGEKSLSSGAAADIFAFGFFSGLRSTVRPVTQTNEALDAGITAFIFSFWERAARDREMERDEKEEEGGGVGEEEKAGTGSQAESEKDTAGEKTPAGKAAISRVSGYAYEPSYYVSDINRENAQTLQVYGASGKLTASYAYGAGMSGLPGYGAAPRDSLEAERLSADIRAPGALGKGLSYYLYDGRGSVTEAVPASGAPAKGAYAYDPFGEPLSGPGLGGELPFFGYGGEEYSPQTKLQYLRARHYDPADGRFGSKDIYPGSLPDPLSQNRYAYAGNNPINYADPSGHFFKAIGNALTNVGKAVVNGVNTVISGVKTAANAVYTKVIQPAASWVNSHIAKPVSNFVEKTKDTVTTGVKNFVGDVKQAVRDVYDDAVAAGTYISQKVKEAKESVRRFACETAERVGSFVEEHANVFKVIAGVAIIAGLGVATVLTGGLAGIAGAALIGAVIGGGSGALVGGAMSALSGGSFWDGAADGFLWGVIGGALGGGVGGMLSGPAAGTAGTASTVAGSVLGRGVVDTIVDTGVDMARMTLTGGITLSGFVDSIASNALMEFATAGTAPPGSARTVKNAVDNALDTPVASGSVVSGIKNRVEPTGNVMQSIGNKFPENSQIGKDFSYTLQDGNSNWRV